MISFIISVLDRPHFLNACLASLEVQKGRKEYLVCANTREVDVLKPLQQLSDRYGARMLSTGLDGALDCYESANKAIPYVNGEWLAFPSDDTLYVCEFASIMLGTAQEEQADLVYCDCIYRQEKAKGNWPPYTILQTSPVTGRIDKTCFIVKRSVFEGFPPHPKGWRDGALIEELIRSGVRHAKAPGVLVVHQ